MAVMIGVDPHKASFWYDFHGPRVRILERRYGAERRPDVALIGRIVRSSVADMPDSYCARPGTRVSVRDRTSRFENSCCTA